MQLGDDLMSSVATLSMLETDAFLVCRFIALSVKYGRIGEWKISDRKY